MQCIEYWIGFVFIVVSRQKHIHVDISFPCCGIVLIFFQSTVRNASFFFRDSCRGVFCHHIFYLFHICSWIRFIRTRTAFWECCDFSQQIILNQLEVCTVYAAALIHICCQTCCIAGECTGNALSCQCQIYAVNDTVCIDIAQMKRLGFPCTEDRRSAHSTDCLVQIEVICTFCGFHIQHHIRGICRNLIVFVGKLYPLTLDGSSLCHGGVLCLAVGIGICQLQEKLVSCIAVKVFHVNAKAVFFSRYKHLGI